MPSAVLGGGWLWKTNDARSLGTEDGSGEKLGPVSCVWSGPKCSRFIADAEAVSSLALGDLLFHFARLR